MSFRNVYDDMKRAEAYAKLEFPGTYYLAYRDLPAIIAEHVKGQTALDFGCGTGRSTRFLKSLGFDVVGVDIAEDMLAQARARDPEGHYRLIGDDGLGELQGTRYDLALSVFTFDNIPTLDQKISLFRGLGDLLSPEGKIVSVVSAPEIYTHEWASFTTKAFPENRSAKSGDTVRIVMTDVEDQRPVEDVVWSDESYRETYAQAGLELMQVFKPLAQES
ncbi:MAG TPA: class I SAM-dependent methyltransferase, partial [Acidobacteriota bacterium]|nr:class I SAM-dependent methyltransferase [Acidobacteriota bacterium]